MLQCKACRPTPFILIIQSIQDFDISQSDLKIANFTKPEIQQRYYSETKNIAESAVDKIVIENHKISILISKRKLQNALAGSKPDNNPNDGTIEISAYVKFKSYAGRKIAYSTNGNAINISKTDHDQTLIRAITRSYKWNKMLDSGEVKTV